MIRSMDRRVARLATVGAIAAALAFAGCGRKGPLDPPPSAVAAQPVPADPTLGEGTSDPLYSGFRRPPAAQTQPAAKPAGQPQATAQAQPEEKKGFFLDWLLQ